jgi:hypothetical protein
MINDWILSPSNLVMILTTEFIRETGIKSLTIVGLFTFGIRVIKELFSTLMSTSPLKKSKQALYMSSLIMF